MSKYIVEIGIIDVEEIEKIDQIEKIKKIDQIEKIKKIDKNEKIGYQNNIQTGINRKNRN